MFNHNFQIENNIIRVIRTNILFEEQSDEK